MSCDVRVAVHVVEVLNSLQEVTVTAQAYQIGIRNFEELKKWICRWLYFNSDDFQIVFRKP